MKNIKVLLFVFAAFYMVTGLFARDVETHSVENLKSWQDSFDLNSRKAGKYNIMVKAIDLTIMLLLKVRLIFILIRILTCRFAE